MLPVDRETLMLYTSFVRPMGPGILNSYGVDADVIGVGSTGGGVEFTGSEPLSWEELARDLRMAYRWTDDIFIFSLEGCVEQGFLSQLQDFDWEQPVDMPTAQIEQVDRLRALLRGVLWAGSHPVKVLAGLAGIFCAFLGLRRLLIIETDEERRLGVRPTSPQFPNPANSRNPKRRCSVRFRRQIHF